MTLDLVLRYATICVAYHLACAWAQAFQSPWPLVDAFELAESFDDQLFRSIGIKFDSAAFCRLSSVARFFAPCCVLGGLRKAPKTRCDPWRAATSPAFWQKIRVFGHFEPLSRSNWSFFAKR